MPLSRSSQKRPKRNPPAKKQWKAALSKPSATLGTKARLKASPVEKTLPLLEKYYPNATCALNFETPFQLLIATILSAQCTDERVNQVTAVLFPRYPDAKALAAADLLDIEAIIRPTGFFKAKAKNINGAAKALMEHHGGEVPKVMADLVALPGVGRKTANVVLGTAYGIGEGVVVDTHVLRLSKRLGWTKSEDPLQVEKDLQALIPRDKWIEISHLLILHGRAICNARKPACSKCFLLGLCPRIGVKVSV